MHKGFNMSKLETALETLNVEISRYVVSNDNTHEVVVVGGIEVIDRYPVRDFAKVNGSWDKIDVKAIGHNDRILLPFRYTDIELKASHIEELIKFRTLKAINKEQASSYEVVTKDELKNKIVYIHESNPSTNSIALAEQFQLKHFHVIEQIFKLAEQNPSILMGIKYGVYTEVKDKGGIRKTLNDGNRGVIESSITPTNNDGNIGVSESSLTPTNKDNTQDIYNTFLHISEDVYYDFVSSLGTPKSKEMKVYRYNKKREYFEAFKNLRDDLLTKDYREADIERIIKIRTTKTRVLQTTITDYVTHYNNNSGELKQLNLTDVSRLVFNVINDKAGIDAKTYHLKLLDRNDKDVNMQRELDYLEYGLSNALSSGKTKGSSLLVCMEYGLNITKEDIKKHLINKGVGELMSLIG